MSEYYEANIILLDILDLIHSQTRLILVGQWSERNEKEKTLALATVAKEVDLGHQEIVLSNIGVLKI